MVVVLMAWTLAARVGESKRLAVGHGVGEEGWCGLRRAVAPADRGACGVWHCHPLCDALALLLLLPAAGAWITKITS